MGMGRSRRSGGDGQIRIFIAEDETEVRKTLRKLLEMEPKFEVVGEAADAGEAARDAAYLLPDVALVDVRMPAGGGVRATEEIRRVSPETRVVAFTASADSRTVLEMMGAGAWGYIIKGTPGPAIVAAVRKVSRGESILSPSVSPPVLQIRHDA